MLLKSSQLKNEPKTPSGSNCRRECNRFGILVPAHLVIRRFLYKVQNRFLIATKRLYKSVCPSAGPSIGPSVLSVTLSLFGLLGATDAVYTALFNC